MRPGQSDRCTASRTGVVLAAVMIITALAGMVAAGLLFRMRASVAVSAAVDNGEQAYAAAMSGVTRAVEVVQEGISDMDFWYDNPDVFQNQQVYDDGANVWYFSVYANDPLDPTKVRYGLSDEAGKVNICHANEQELRGLTILSEEMVDCLLDYRDSDYQRRQLGAEQEYYDDLPYPYLIRNSRMETVEELLLVKNFDASVVYGEDVNLNGLLDPNENDGDETFPVDDADGLLDLGVAGLTTVLSCEPSMTSQGEPRMSMNAEPQSMLDAGIPYDAVAFIVGYLSDGGSIPHASSLLGARHRLSKDCKLWDGTTLYADTVIESRVSEEDLPLVMDLLDSGQGGAKNMRYGQINVNTARAEALASVPEIDQALAESIVTVRSGLDSRAKYTTAWLYTRGVLDETTFRKVAPSLTAQSYQFRVRSIGFGVPCGRIRAMEAVIDIATGETRLRYIRDLTHLGMPFAIDMDQLADDEEEDRS